MKQLTYYEIENQRETFPVTIVCDTIRTPENIGMCFRIAESFGVSKVYIHESSPTSENRIVRKTSRNALHEIDFDRYTNFEKLINQLKNERNTIIGIEITDESIKIQDFDFKNHQKLVFLLGSERNGINHVNLADASVSIPMYGRNSSMNVVHSLAITLYEVTNQLIKND